MKGDQKMSNNISRNTTESELTRANAYTVNTFNLDETEKSIIAAKSNSFNYLKNLQSSYMQVYRFNLNESDLYINQKRNVSVSIDKDFIDNQLRKRYKDSEYYNKYLQISTVLSNSDIFSFAPIVFIDGKMIYSFEIKAALDGHTDISFPHIIHKKSFMTTNHNIEIILVKNMIIRSFIIKKSVIMNRQGVLIYSDTNIKFDNNVVFISMRKASSQNDNNVEGTNIYTASVSEDGNLVIDMTNKYISKFISNCEWVEIAVIMHKNIYSTGDPKKICVRIDNNDKSAIAITEPSDNSHYNMVIPPENLFILRVNKQTDEHIYENNRDVILHYPKIYEIMSNDIDKDLYEYKVFYFYNEARKSFNYRDKYEYIHKYISDTMSMSLESAVNKLLYTNYSNSALQTYYLKLLNYDDETYHYDYNDFSDTYYPYNMDYKIEKMNEFIIKDPYTLSDYAKNVSTPSSVYYLYIKDIDLTNRIRYNTNDEASNDSDKFELNEPCYLFRFMNNDGTFLDLRFFIDGILYPDPTYICDGTTDYIYIPVRLINDDSYIEVEKFYTYTITKQITINSTTEGVTVEFEHNDDISPTLYDLYITSIDGKKMNRELFKIYTLVDFGEYDASDYIYRLSENISFILEADYIIDEITNELYINMVEEYDEVDESIMLIDDVCQDDDNGRLPIKHMLLNKIKIFCNDNDIVGKPIKLNIDKNPQIINTVVGEDTSTEIPVYYFNNTLTDKTSYMRTFINGKMIPFEYEVNDDNGQFYIIPNCTTSADDIITLDITPFSYKLIYETEAIPEDFIIDLSDYLDKPFNTKYYDVYLNGRKLCDRNICAITPTLIKIFNVHSKNNLYIYQKDRDYEFYGFKTGFHVPLDKFLNSGVISNNDRIEIINNVIYDNCGNFDDGDNIETNWNNLYGIIK